MKLAIDFSSRYVNNPVKRALESTVNTLVGDGITITIPEEADVVIANDLSKLLHYLKQGKNVIQFLCWNETPATGLLSAPNFKDRFHIFASMEGMPNGYPGYLKMVNYLQELAQKEKTHEDFGS